MTDRWVVRLDDGWLVTSQDRTPLSRRFDLQVEAIIEAERQLVEAGGGELVIVRADGHVEVKPIAARRHPRL